MKRMLVRILQIKDLENCRYAFGSWRLAEKHFNIKDYREVYNYFLDVRPCKENNYRILMTEDEKSDCLDKIWSRFNINRPDDFKGHSLSMSDVVDLGGELYYCDVFGWRKING